MPTTRNSRAAQRAHAGSGSRVVVTGSAGFIGHHLVRALQDRGDEVLVIDDLSGEFGGALSAPTGVERLDITRGDLRHVIARWRPTIVYHLAAQVSVARSMHDPEVKVIGTLRVV
jgi:UDP-glucose 4-epimerase